MNRHAPTATVAKHISADLADPARIDAAAQELGTGWDTLINVAGLPGTQPDNLVFEVNLLGLRHLTESMFDAPNPEVRSSTAGYRWQERPHEQWNPPAANSFELRPASIGVVYG
ncbi:hypothetical protein SAMN06265360_1541 [Haloechinothrix alba]|uniref:Short chain dehydrogenase n=1 Tax=Haloechinothrix alba TaxID=664784 RepID=A0A239ARI5_9PSEU|nr:hypothetical protein [Haloechinothrix alba]SNR97961.1 hypothetical protein SAMN06265360_1541 [Haloechinothrix alba]